MTFNELITLFTRYIHRLNDIDVVQMCGLAEGTNNATIKTISAIVYQLYNQQFTKAATDNIAMTVCAQQPVNSFCFYIVSIDVLGAVKVTKGTNNTYVLPNTPQGESLIGAIKVVTDASHTFTSGTTDLSAAGITAACYDIDTGIAATLINEAQRKMERGIVVNLNGYPVRVSDFDHMKVRTQIPIVFGNYAINNPFPNYKELINAHLIDSAGHNYPELVRMEYNEAMYLYPYLASSHSRPLIISRIPSSETDLSPDIFPTLQFLLRPSCDTNYTLDIQAYQYSPDLDGVIYSTDWWTLNAPEILLLGALVEAAPYLKEDERIVLWEKKLGEALAGLAGSQRQEKYSGSKLNIRFISPLTYGTYDITTDTYIGG